LVGSTIIMYTIYKNTRSCRYIRPGFKIAFRVDFAQTWILELELSEKPE
jgi:hypothetical protein